MRGRAITVGLIGLVALLALAFGTTVAAADPPEWSNGHHHATPTPSAEPSPSPTASSTASSVVETDPPALDGPPGNNGTVKVNLDALPFDKTPNNEPHVGCRFQIDFYGLDLGDVTVRYLFELWSPTGSGELLRGERTIGEYPAGGGKDLHGSITIDLEDAVEASGEDPHPKQGYHVKLTVHAEGSIGADVKHKVFWVTCSAPQGATVAPPPTTVPPPTVATQPPTVQPTVLPSTIRPPRGLAFTGKDLEGMALAFALVLFGTAALRASHRRERRHYNRG